MFAPQMQPKCGEGLSKAMVLEDKVTQIWFEVDDEKNIDRSGSKLSVAHSILEQEEKPQTASQIEESSTTEVEEALQ